MGGSIVPMAIDQSPTCQKPEIDYACPNCRTDVALGSFAMQPSSAAGTASPAVGPNAYREYLKAAGFSKDELKTIYAFNDRRAVLDFLGALASTAALPWLYWIYPSWITVVV